MSWVQKPSSCTGHRTSSVASEESSGGVSLCDLRSRSLRRNVKKLVKTCKKGWSKELAEILLSVAKQAAEESDVDAGLTLTFQLLEGVERVGEIAQSPLLQTYLVLQDIADKVKHVPRDPSVSPRCLQTTYTFWENLHQQHLRVIRAFPAAVERLLRCLGGRLLQSTLSPALPTLFRQTRCRALNALLERSSTQQRGIFRNANIVHFFELPDSLGRAGDYDFQTSLLETLFRLSSYSERSASVSRWFPRLPCTHQALFTRIVDFDPDCRRFLNAYNNLLGPDRLVHTFAATSVTIGCLKVQKPDVASYEQLWVDFNLGSSTLSVLCDKTDPGVTAADRVWETLVVYADEVVRSTLVRTLHSDTLDLVLSRPVLEYFSEPPAYASQDHQLAELQDPEPVYKLVFEPTVSELAAVAAKLLGTKLEMVDNTPTGGALVSSSLVSDGIKGRRSSTTPNRKRRKCSVTSSLKTSACARGAADDGCPSSAGSGSSFCETSCLRHSKKNYSRGHKSPKARKERNSTPHKAMDVLVPEVPSQCWSGDSALVEIQEQRSDPPLSTQKITRDGRTATTTCTGHISSGSNKTSITSARILCHVVAETSPSPTATGSEEIIPSSVTSAFSSTKACSRTSAAKSRYRRRSEASSNGSPGSIQRQLSSRCHENVQVNTSLSYTAKTCDRSVTHETRLATPVLRNGVSVVDEAENKSASRTPTNICASAEVVNSTSCIASPVEDTSCSHVQDLHSIASRSYCEGCSSKIKDSFSIGKPLGQTPLYAQKNFHSNNTPIINSESSGSGLKKSSLSSSYESTNSLFITNKHSHSVCTPVTSSQGSRVIISAESAQCRTIYPELSSPDEVGPDLDTKSALSASRLNENPAGSTKGDSPINSSIQEKLGTSPLKELKSDYTKCSNKVLPNVSHVLDANKPNQASNEVDTEDEIVPSSLTQTREDNLGTIVSRSKLSLNRGLTRIVSEDKASDVISAASVLVQAEVGSRDTLVSNNFAGLVSVDTVCNNNKPKEDIDLRLDTSAVATIKNCTASNPVASLVDRSMSPSRPNLCPPHSPENPLKFNEQENLDCSSFGDAKYEAKSLSTLEPANCEAMPHHDIDDKRCSSQVSPISEERGSGLLMGSSQQSKGRSQKRSLEASRERSNSSVSNRIKKARCNNAGAKQDSCEPRGKKTKHEKEGFSIRTPKQFKGVSYDPGVSFPSVVGTCSSKVNELCAGAASAEDISTVAVASAQMATCEVSEVENRFASPPSDSNSHTELCTKPSSTSLKADERAVFEVSNVTQQCSTVREQYSGTDIMCNNIGVSASGLHTGNVPLVTSDIMGNSQKEIASARPAQPVLVLQEGLPVQDYSGKDNAAHSDIDLLPPAEKLDGGKSDHVQIVNGERVEYVEYSTVNPNYDHLSTGGHQLLAGVSTPEAAPAFDGQDQLSSIGASMVASRILISDAGQTLMDENHDSEITDAKIFAEVINECTVDIPTNAESPPAFGMGSNDLRELKSILCSPQVITDLDTGVNYDAACQELVPCNRAGVRHHVTLSLTEQLSLFELNLENDNLVAQPLFIDAGTVSSLNRSTDVDLTEEEEIKVKVLDSGYKLDTPRRKSRRPSLIFNDATSSSGGRKGKKSKNRKNDLPEHYMRAGNSDPRARTSTNSVLTSGGKARGCKKKLFTSSRSVLNATPPNENVGESISNTDATITFGDLVPIESSCNEGGISVLGEDSRSSSHSKRTMSTEKKGCLKMLAKNLYEEKASQVRSFNGRLPDSVKANVSHDSLCNGEKKSKFFTTRDDLSSTTHSKAKLKTMEIGCRFNKKGGKKVPAPVKRKRSTLFSESDNDIAPNGSPYHTTVYSDVYSSSGHSWLEGKSKKNFQKYSIKSYGKSYLKAVKVSSGDEHYSPQKNAKKKATEKRHRKHIYSNEESKTSNHFIKSSKAKYNHAKSRDVKAEKSDRHLRKPKPTASYKAPSTTDSSFESLDYAVSPRKKAKKTKHPNRSWTDQVVRDRSFEILRDCSNSSADKSLQIYEDLDCEKENLIFIPEDAPRQRASLACHPCSNKENHLDKAERGYVGENFTVSSDSLELPPVENCVISQHAAETNSKVIKLTRFLEHTLPETKADLKRTLKNSIAKETGKKILLKVPPNTPASISPSTLLAAGDLSSIGDKKTSLKLNGPLESTHLDESSGKHPKLVWLSEIGGTGASPQLQSKGTKSSARDDATVNSVASGGPIDPNFDSNIYNLQEVNGNMIHDRPCSSNDSATESRKRKVKIRTTEHSAEEGSVDFDAAFYGSSSGKMREEIDIPADRNLMAIVDDDLALKNSKGKELFFDPTNGPMKEACSKILDISRTLHGGRAVLKAGGSSAIAAEDDKRRHLENFQLPSTTESSRKAASPLASASSGCRWSLECGQPTRAADDGFAGHVLDPDVTRLNTNQGMETPQRVKGRTLFSPAMRPALEDMLPSQALSSSDHRSDLVSVPRSRLLLLHELLSALSQEINCRVPAIIDEVNSLLGSDL